MESYYQDNHVTIYNKDCRSMEQLGNESVQMVVTSPPYWGLRKYAGLPDLVWGEDPNCGHDWRDATYKRRSSDGLPGFSKERYDDKTYEELRRDKPIENAFCSKCSAWRGAFGLEPQPQMYIEHTIEILREIRRVLRKDGVIFWNIGDSYASNGIYIGKYKETHPEHQDFHTKHSHRYPQKQKGYRGGSIKAKDLCLIPFRVAIAAQEDGWWVRSVIIWSKPNPMPESVTDRPTESHEYILMLTKSACYYFDQDAVREEYLEPMNRWGGQTLKANGQSTWDEGTGQSWYRDRDMRPNPAGRNIRTVWEFSTQPYPEAHFAVFPEKLPEICIKAATPEVGCCSKCGAPWERVIERKILKPPRGQSTKDAQQDVPSNPMYRGRSHNDGWADVEYKTLGWRPTCNCKTIKPPVASLVLDPFAGAGTTLWVAKKLGRRAVGYELSEEYCQLSVERNRQQALF